MHSVTVRNERGERRDLVLRRWVTGDRQRRSELVNREARVLDVLGATDVPAPRRIATDSAGDQAGYPSLLMTRLPGHIHLTPRAPQDWLGQMAAVLPRIHRVAATLQPFEAHSLVEDLEVPSWSERPMLWQEAVKVVRSGAPAFTPAFIHHDYQHFNLLWSRERLSGIVDWVLASNRPPDVDVGHCRLNLAVLFSADWAEQFRFAYEFEAGRRVDPWWDLRALMAYSDEWQAFIPLQVGRRGRVDIAGMHRRVEDLLALALKRM
jgi:aminoglycoside phosphotransferase (APT) family kinase protein